MKSALTSFFFTIILLFLETAILSNMYFLPVVPDLLLLYTVYVSLHRGCLHGETEGFASGLMLDCVSAAPLGLNAMLRTLIGFLGGQFFLTINTQGIFIPFLIGFIASIAKVIILSIISFFFPGNVFSYDIFTSTAWIEVLLNACLAPLLFAVFSKFEAISSEPSETVDSTERVD